MKISSPDLKVGSSFSKRRLVIFGVIFAFIGIFLLFKSLAAEPVVASLQVEQMTLNTGASIISDTSSVGGQAVKFSQAGSTATSAVSFGSSVSSLNVVAKANGCRSQVWPVVKLSVDGSAYLKVQVKSTVWTTYSATANIGSGSHTAVVSYISSSTKCIPILYADSVTFFGSIPTAPPTVYLSASPTNVSSGQTSTLTWSSLNATNCLASGAWSGTKPLSGSINTGNLSVNSTYSLTCSGTGGTAGATTIVTVATSTPPPVTGLWKPTADKAIGLQWVLGDALNVSDQTQMGLKDFNGNTLNAPDVYDIDGEYNTASTVSYLHNQGKKAICYIDAGVYETYRSDAYKFQALTPQIWGNNDNGWNGSYWLDIRRINDLEPIMQARMQMCKDKGFDAIEPDEITNWSNNPGFPITYQDQIIYNQAVASWAHQLGLSIGLKGDLEQAHDLVNNFDWTLNEECYQYSECTLVNNSGGPGADGKDYPGLQLFVQQNKAVWVAEYKNYSATQWGTICADSSKNHFNTSLFKLGLPNNGGRQPCLTTSSW